MSTNIYLIVVTKCQQIFTFNFVHNADLTKLCKFLLTNCHVDAILMMLTDSHETMNKGGVVRT